MGSKSNLCWPRVMPSGTATSALRSIIPILLATSRALSLLDRSGPCLVQRRQNHRFHHKILYSLILFSAEPATKWDMPIQASFIHSFIQSTCIIYITFTLLLFHHPQCIQSAGCSLFHSYLLTVVCVCFSIFATLVPSRSTMS